MASERLGAVANELDRAAEHLLTQAKEATTREEIVEA
jgi:hypothetical protein